MTKSTFYTRIRKDGVDYKVSVSGYTETISDGENELSVGLYRFNKGDWHIVELTTGLEFPMCIRKSREDSIDNAKQYISAISHTVKHLKLDVSSLPEAEYEDLYPTGDLK